MKSLSKTACRVLSGLVAGLKPGAERTVDAGRGFMPLHVIMRSERVVSLAHFYEQNGDLMADPEMDFWFGPDGRWYPVSYRLDGLGVRQQAAEFNGAGEVARYALRMQADQTKFANMWMRNIKQQQNL